LPSRRKAPREGEWRNYFGDTNGTKYSPLSQIDRTNVGSLRVAWRWASADRALQLSNPQWRSARNEETPLMVRRLDVQTRHASPCTGDHRERRTRYANGRVHEQQVHGCLGARVNPST
jgi:hypothetical protein